MTSAEYIGRVVEVARKHGATIRETTRGANIQCPGGALLEVYVDTYRDVYRDVYRDERGNVRERGVHHEAQMSLRNVRWGDIECLADIKRLVESLPKRVDGPAPTYAPAASPSGYGSGAIDDTKGT